MTGSWVGAALIGGPLVLVGVLLGGCGENAMGPALASDGLQDPTVAGSAGVLSTRLRIVEPASGALLVTGSRFTVRAVQEIQEGPLWGLLRLQRSLDAITWTDVGPESPWSRQELSIEVPWARVDETGICLFRFVVREERSQSPFLVSSVQEVTSVLTKNAEADLW